MIPRLTQKARHVLTVSEFSRREILDLLKPNPEKVTVVPNAVSTTIARLANEVTENRYGRYVLAVSSLDPRKNFSTILDAFARLPKSDCQLVLVGSESVIFIDPGLKKQIEQIPNAVFTGYLGDRELVALYRHAICLVYPSIYEGFGLPPIEAMACGCPVIVSRTTSLPEVCGNAALYCDPYDPQDWADKISEIIGNPTLSNDLRLRGFSQIRRYSWEKSAQSILDVVKRLTAG
jgi:glycosyltransferase involved in cell wall biosynthesis